MLHIKDTGKSIEHHASKYSALIHILDPWVGQNIFSDGGHVANQTNGKDV